MLTKDMIVKDSASMNRMLDAINHCFIRIDRGTGELERIMRDHQFNDTPLLPEAVKLAGIFLEFKEILDGTNSLFHYLKDCAEDDRALLDKVEERVHQLEVMNTTTKVIKKAT